MNRTITNYQQLPNVDNSNLDVIEPVRNDTTHEFLPIEMFYFDSDGSNSTRYTILNNTLGPFDNMSDKELKNFIS